MLQPVLIAGQWRPAAASGAFQAENPATLESLPEQYPISDWADCDAALAAAHEAYGQLRAAPVASLAAFLEDFAGRIEAQAGELVERAHQETALAKSPRLADVELPRTANQLRAAAQAARDGSWRLPTIDSQSNIRSMFDSLGPVAVFGPNNFPLAFNSASGGDFAAAIAAGNPVIAKANTSHPGTTRLLAQAAHEAARTADLPAGTIQLLYRTSHEDGERLVADPRLGATGYTGSRAAGLALKRAADAAGKPIYLELSSVNPVVILPGGLDERGSAIADEFAASCLMGAGQFCTNPGLLLLLESTATSRFVKAISERFAAAPTAALLSRRVRQSLATSVGELTQAGAKVLCGGQEAAPGARYANTLLTAPASKFIERSEALQTEAFGNASLVVVARDVEELLTAIECLEGNLTGCVYSAPSGADDAIYARIEPALRAKVGRLLNDKMPTGVAVSPAMNHGGPYPATGHPGFTAVGIPAALRRFARLNCYDNVRADRLPKELRDKNPTGKLWRWIDGEWTTRHAVAPGRA
ncbi:MAG: aldehyde dehydrogenase (NADP(+)) [Pirellulales bacterium]|nr:aldehyde dehydrogenase (NADP(+)) [Pirellulales bacterium]